MNLPQALQIALERELTKTEWEQMARDAQAISLRYRTQSGGGKRLLTLESEALAYAQARMPATYYAVYTALKHALAASAAMPETLLDAGAGTGAAAWAADALMPLQKAVCLEREDAMRHVGQGLMQSGSPALQAAEWRKGDLCRDALPLQADLVTCAYVLNELEAVEREAALYKLWDAAQMLLLVVEPGTPKGYANLMDARRMLLGRGAHIAAPCPHEDPCPMPEGDWCHFACRVQRSRLHRQLKGGEAPFEDEKFAYMAFSKGPCRPANARILRHPMIHTGHVSVTVCTGEGIQVRTLTKKDGASYKLARDVQAGEGFPVFSDHGSFTES